jgi:membrane protease YdiL (CAAX protease family)
VIWTSLFLVFMAVVMPALALFSKRQLDAGFVFPRIRFYLESMFFQGIILTFAVFIASRENIPLTGAPPPTPEDLALGLGIVLGALLVMWASLRWSPRGLLERAFMIAPETYNEKLTWIFVSAVAALTEETAYRAVLFTIVSRLAPSVAVAIIITSALFALAHLAQGWSSATIVYIYAIAFQYLYISTESLLVPVLAHFLYDVAAGLYLAARRPDAAV